MSEKHTLPLNDANERLRALLLAMSNRVIKAEEQAVSFSLSEKPWKQVRAKEFRSQANLLRDLLSKNRPSLTCFFGTCDPKQIAGKPDHVDLEGGTES